MSLLETHPLPRIHDEQLLSQVFTHRSVIGKPRRRLEDPEPVGDNDRLSFLGDGVIHLVTTTAVEQALPLSRQGDLDKKRALLCSRDRIASWSTEYRLMKSLRVHTAQSELIQNSEDAKVDVFKAYVGALYKEGGLECVEEWLMPVVDAALNEIRMMEQKENDLADSLQDTSLDGSSGGKSASSGNPSGRTRTEPNSSKANAGNIEATLTSSLALFNQECAKKNITPEWQHAVEGPPHTPLFTATVLLPGEREPIGRGKGARKKQAEQEAALQALGALESM